MYICLCNPFTDKDVHSFLKDCNGKASVSEVYKCCSGGENPNCCACIQNLKDIVRTHNTNVTVQAMSATFSEAPAEPETEKA